MSKLTVTIPDDLHQKIREELERQGITTSQFIEQANHLANDVDIGHLVPATDVVHLAHLPTFQDAADGGAVIGDIKPIADLHTVAVDGQGFAGQGVGDHQRDKFFREVIGAVIVGAVAGGHR